MNDPTSLRREVRNESMDDCINERRWNRRRTLDCDNRSTTKATDDSVEIRMPGGDDFRRAVWNGAPEIGGTKLKIPPAPENPKTASVESEKITRLFDFHSSKLLEFDHPSTAVREINR